MVSKTNKNVDAPNFVVLDRDLCKIYAPVDANMQ